MQRLRSEERGRRAEGEVVGVFQLHSQALLGLGERILLRIAGDGYAMSWYPSYEVGGLLLDQYLDLYVKHFVAPWSTIF